MKSSCAFLTLNFLICLLFNAFSYNTILNSFSFFDQNEDFNFVLVIFCVAYTSLNIFVINNLIEDKLKVYKYIYVRSNNKNAVKKYIVRLLNEISLISISKIICDFIFWVLFDRNSIIVFSKTSVALYLSVLLWFVIFDCLSNFRISTNMVALIMIFMIMMSNLLIRYSNLFSVLIINTYDDTIIYLKIILFKLLLLLFVLVCDIKIKIQKDYF